MKKLLLALLLLPEVVCAIDKDVRFEESLERFGLLDENRKKQYQDPEWLKFILGNKYLDLHIFGVFTPGIAQVAAVKIHERFKNVLIKEKNDFKKAGESLVKSPDAVIINTCTTMEQNRRKTGDVGMITCNKRGWLYSWGQTQFNGENFYRRGCDCDFYQKLTVAQLEQLRQGTQATPNKKFIK